MGLAKVKMRKGIKFCVRPWEFPTYGRRWVIPAYVMAGGFPVFVKAQNVQKIFCCCWDKDGNKLLAQKNVKSKNKIKKSLSYHNSKNKLEIIFHFFFLQFCIQQSKFYID